ncbi:hypothetical protein KAJ87_01965 [Candidatus Pacearchaeota archaeon]|nr:hypothetical protein [Candidatus Pacearchaeota archaeon]
MGIVKLLTGKTLKRHFTEDPGNIKEFFEMVKEKGEKDVNANIIEYPNQTWDMFDYKMCPSHQNCIRTKYQSSTIEFIKHENYSNLVEPVENYNGTKYNIKRGDVIKHFTIEEKDYYSKKFPELKITLQKEKEIRDSIKELTEYYETPPIKFKGVEDFFN